MEKSHCIVGEEIVHWDDVGFTLSFFLHFGMQPADRVHTSRVLPMTVGAVPDAPSELCCLVFAPVNPLDTLVHWGMFLVQAVSAPNRPFSLCPCPRSSRSHFPSFPFHFLITSGPCWSPLRIKLGKVLLELFC